MSRNTTKRAVEIAFADGSVVTCAYCDRVVRIDVVPTAKNRAVGDHMVPRARGGSNTLTNIAIVCHECDSAKGPLTLAEFLMVRHSEQALAHLKATVASVLNGSLAPVPPTRRERREARQARREAQLQHRLQLPDPECDNCGGTGQWRPAKGRKAYCRCAIKDPIGRQEQK